MASILSPEGYRAPHVLWNSRTTWRVDQGGCSAWTVGPHADLRRTDREHKSPHQRGEKYGRATAVGSCARNSIRERTWGRGALPTGSSGGVSDVSVCPECQRVLHGRESSCQCVDGRENVVWCVTRRRGVGPCPRGEHRREAKVREAAQLWVRTAASGFEGNEAGASTVRGGRQRTRVLRSKT